MDIKGALWTPLAGYCTALLVAAMWWGASQSPLGKADPPAENGRPLAPVNRASLPCRPLSVPASTDSPDEPLPDDAEVDAGGEQPMAHSLNNPHVDIAPARPAQIVVRPKPLILIGGQMTGFPVAASVDLGIRWGRCYIGPVWSIWPQGYGLRASFCLF